MPKGVATRVATAATRNESWIAIHSVGEISNTASGARADQEIESISFKHSLGTRRAQECEITEGFWVPRSGCGDRINDGGMRVVRECANDLDPGLQLGVCRIDNPENSFASCNQGQRGAHALGHGQSGFGGPPGA